MAIGAKRQNGQSPAGLRKIRANSCHNTPVEGFRETGACAFFIDYKQGLIALRIERVFRWKHFSTKEPVQSPGALSNEIDEIFVARSIPPAKWKAYCSRTACDSMASAASNAR